MGYVSDVEVIVECGSAAVDEVQLCTDEGCSSPALTAAPVPALSVGVTNEGVQLPKGGFSPAPGLRVPPPIYPGTANIGSRQGDNTWRFTFILGPVPTHITLRALDEDGALLAEQVNDLECPSPASRPAPT